MNNAPSRYNPNFPSSNSTQPRGPRERIHGDRNSRQAGPGRTTLTGKLIRTGQGEAIVVKFKLWMFQVNLLVNIPFEGDDLAPVYAEIEPVRTADILSPIAAPEEETTG